VKASSEGFPQISSRCMLAQLQFIAGREFIGSARMFYVTDLSALHSLEKNLTAV